MAVFEQIRVQTAFPIHRLEDVQIHWRPGEHGRLTLRGIVDEAVNVSAAMQATASDEIRVYESDGPSETTLFHGFVSSIKTTHANGVHHLELEGLSGSCRLDAHKRRRTFQDVKMTYGALTAEIGSTYEGYDVLCSVGQDAAIGFPVLQYEETDWELLQRLASHFQSVIVCDILEARPKLYFGMPQGKSISLPKETPYTANKDLLAFRRAGGYEAGLHDTDFFYYEIESLERFNLGDELEFRNKRMVISEVVGRMSRGQFKYTYRLSRTDGIRRSSIYNEKLTGISLEGEVLAVQGEQVKLHLNVDPEQPKDKAHWYPFAPATGSAMYSMPKAGTRASLYIPDAEGRQGIVVGAVRTDGGSHAKTSDPSKRYFGTEHGSELEITPTAVHISGGSKEPLKLSFDDATGVSLTSHKKLTLNAMEDISLYTPKRIVIRAQSQLMAKKLSAQSGFAIESEYHFLGANVKAEGRDRATYTPFDDEPKQGTPPPPPEPEKKKKFNWGKLLVCAVAVVVVVAAVAVSVATFGAGAVVGAALVAAAFGAIGAVARTAAADRANHTRSSLGEYLESAARGALIGLVVGAVFGPVGGVVGAEALAVQTTGQLALGIGTTLLVGGATNYTDYVLNETLDGRNPNLGQSIEAFKDGMLLSGGFMVATPWLMRGCIGFSNYVKQLAGYGSNLGKVYLKEAQGLIQKLDGSFKSQLQSGLQTANGAPLRAILQGSNAGKALPKNERQLQYIEVTGNAEKSAAKGTGDDTYRHLKDYENNKYFTRSVEYNAGKDGTGFTYKVYQRNDIDWKMVRTTGAKKGRGLTNAEAAAKYGLAPILDDAGNVATLHHSQQKGIGPLFEASTRYHNISNAKRPPLHPYKGKLNPFYPMDEATREAFQKVDSINYWKKRGSIELGGE
ncbi:hypothetical protein [Paenibacillus rigui]|uniref:hypothetical protein n=1 Tax=Paenibacillus rigui TaxID=554312 RepID=UPI0015C63C0F|nr:hypothetical protein [Paenibacillus rigui]